MSEPHRSVPRSDAAIARLRAERGGHWPLIRWVHRRRPILTALLVLVAPAYALASGVRPVDLLAPRPNVLFVLPWVLMGVGAVVRIWGSGNLRKNAEVTDTGIYQMVRHPLYLGNLCFFLAYFLTAAGDAAVGLLLFAALAVLVYYPTMLGEEEFLALKFAGAYERHPDPPPRLLPDLSRLPAALRTDRFSLSVAYRNYGLRSLAFLVALPLFLRVLLWAQGKL